MKLHDWILSYNPVWSVCNSSRIASIVYETWITETIAWELWHLTDYVVESVSGGTIWLHPRNQ